MRNSWLTLLKNAVLARSSSASASARALASSSARALAIAVAICAATSSRKSRYAVVEHQPRAERRRPAAPTGRVVARLRRSAAPASARRTPGTVASAKLAQVDDDGLAPTAHDAGDRPRLSSRSIVGGATAVPARSDAGEPLERRACAVGVEQVDQREREVGRVLAEHLRRDRARLVHRLAPSRVCAASACVVLQPALAEHALRSSR